MAKIKGLTVRGYQSHVDSYFPFAPGLTVVTGPSDGGKTGGTLRVLRWLAQGEPSGDDFLHTLYDPKTGEIRSQAEQAQVIAEMYDGVTIEKIRRKKKTLHLVSTIEEPFEKADTPQEVKDIMGINTYNFGDFEAALNFAYQLEPPFLISESPSAGAKVLGKLAGTEDVDKAIKSVSKDTHAVRKERDIAKGKVEGYTADLLDYLFLEDAIKALSSCEELIVLVDQQDSRRATLLSLQAKHDKDHQAVEEYTVKLETLAGIEAARYNMDALEGMIQRHALIRSYDTDYTVELFTIKSTTEELKKYEHLAQADGMIQGTEFNIERSEGLRNLSTLYTGYSQAATAEGRKVKTQKLEILRNLKILEDCYFGALRDADYVLDQCGTIDKAEEALQQLDTQIQAHQIIKQLHTDYENASRHLQTTAATVDKYKDIPAVTQIQAVESGLAQLKTLKDLKSLHEWAVRDQQSTTEAAVNAGLDVEKAEHELHEAWIATGGTCPLCEREILNL